MQEYEIHGCKIVGKYMDEQTKIEREVVEQCADYEADFYSLYMRLPEGGVDCIKDFDTLEEAKAEYLKLTGENYDS